MDFKYRTTLKRNPPQEQIGSQMYEIQLHLVSWEAYQKVLSEIRRKVFVEEQGVSEEDEWDTNDALSSTKHVLLSCNKISNTHVNRELNYIGTARILNGGKIGRVALLAEYRGFNLGKKLVQYSTAIAIQSFDKAYLGAQVERLHFYQNLDYIAEGETFLDANIDHKMMRFTSNQKNLSKLFTQLFNGNVIRLNGITHYLLHLIQLSQISQRSIDILSQDLNKLLYSDSKVIEKISYFARSNRFSKIRILVQSPLKKISQYHQLINLTRRLSSKIEMKCLEKTVDLKGEAYVLCDTDHLLYFNEEDSLTGFVNYSAKAEVKHYKERFEYLWSKRSDIDEDLKVLSL